MSKKQVIKLKKSDLDKTLIRVSSRSAWETKRTSNLKEQVHRSLKFKKPKHKVNPIDEEVI